MVNAYMRITLLGLLIFSLASCGSTAYPGKDLTYNPSRAKASRTTISRSAGPSAPARRTAAVSETRENLINYAKRHLGTPYRYGGKDPSGFDCSGFTQFVYRTQGLQLPANSRGQAEYGSKLNPYRAQPGDLIIFEDGGKVRHVGLIVDAGPGSIQMIHASSSQGVVIEDVMRSPYWKKRVAYAVSVLGS